MCVARGFFLPYFSLSKLPIFHSWRQSLHFSSHFPLLCSNINYFVRVLTFAYFSFPNQHVDERGNMIGEVEDRSLDEPALDSEGTEDEFSKSEKLKIKYIRDLLLELNGVKVCRKLPRDFDLLILSELGEGSDGAIEHERLSDTSWLCGSLPPTRSRLGPPGERLEDNQSKGSHWLGNCGTIENERLSGKSSLYGFLPPTGSRSGPGERLEDNQSKWSHWLGNCCPEMSDAVCQQVPQKSRFNAAGILGRPIQKGDLHQLKKSENPYRPPHLDKKRRETLDTSVLGAESSEGSSFSPIESNQSGSADSITESEKSGYQFPVAGVDDSVKMQENLDTSFELEAESSEDSSFSPNESNQSGSADSITENDKSEYEFPLPGGDGSVKMQEILDTSSELGAESSEGSSFSPIESNQRGSADSITENDKSEYRFAHAEVGDSVKILFGKCEATWVNNDRIGTVDGNDELKLGIIKDDESTYDEYWDEIVQVFQLQIEPERLPSPTRTNAPDSEVKIWFPDEDSSISIDHSTVSENLKLAALDNSNDIANSEAEINWPDEDSLISIDDMIPPQAEKLTYNGAVNTEKNSQSPNFSKSINRPTPHGCNAQSLLDLSDLATQGKFHPQRSYSQPSTEVFGPQKPSPLNFRTKITTHNTIPYTPSLNCYAYPNFHFQSLQETNLTKTNDSFVQYSLLQQPKMCPEQQTHILVGTPCPNPAKQVAKPEVNTKQFSNWALQRPIYQGFGK